MAKELEHDLWVGRIIPLTTTIWLWVWRDCQVQIIALFYVPGQIWPRNLFSKLHCFLILASIVISFRKFMLCTMYQVPQILSPLSNPTMVFFHVKLNYCFEDHSICMEQTLPPLNNQSFCFVFISAEWKITQVKRESNMKSPFCVGAEFPNGQQHSIFGPRVRAIIHCISAHVLQMAWWTC